MNHTQWILNARLADCTEGWSGEEQLVHIGIKDGNIHALTEASTSPKGEILFDAEHRLVTPGLIDPHTHLIYAGDRANEFALRLAGVSYETIARRGGGIQATVTKTRQATEQQLYQTAKQRLSAWRAHGFTTVEIKSGYGLTETDELKMLRVARQLNSDDLTVYATLLAAHTVPPEFSGQGDAYIQWICDTLLPKAKAEQLADAVDIFCEKIAFNQAQTQKLLAEAKRLGFQLKIHAEQLSHSGGARTAAELGAISADHLEYINDDDIRAMASHGTTAVLLPAAFYCLKETRKPPVAELIQNKVPIALGSDANPGSAPMTQPLLILNMACTLFGLTPSQSLLGVTRYAARALGLSDRGQVAVGYRADLAIWDCQSHHELSYYIGGRSAVARVVNGRLFMN
ncbi:MAG: imidazolonepropionase [Gammaproteobacteria bacterium]|nr:MAG: imidazolonepropionase [Gammaproteobacteria bacterium]